MTIPSMGRIVHYTLSDEDVEEIKQRRLLDHWRGGNRATAGDIYPAVIVRVNDPAGSLNLQVWLDGNDTYWATSRLFDDPAAMVEGHQAGTWHWPLRS